jgi:two-component system LytT family response regulator
MELITKNVNEVMFEISPEISKELKEKKAVIKNNERIIMNTSEGFEFVAVDDIVRCEADGKKTICYLKDERKLNVSTLLKKFEGELAQYNFLRIHHSHLVNVNYVFKYLKIKGKGGLVVMKNGERLAISRRKNFRFLNQLYKKNSFVFCN